MSFKSEIQSIYKILQKIDTESKKQGSDSSDNLFGGLKVVPKSNTIAKAQIDKSKIRQNFAQPYNFLHISKFLDLKTLLNVSSLNKEFNIFINSIYMYKVLFNPKFKKKITKVNSSHSPKSASSATSAKTSKSGPEQNNKMVGLLKNMGNFFFGAKDVKKRNIDPNEIALKLSLHEEILIKMKKQFDVEREINTIREEIDYCLNAKQPEGHKKVNEKISDFEYLMINRDFIKKEYMDLEKEMIVLKKESEKLKRNIDYFEMTDIEKAKSLISIKSYITNNLKIENLKLNKDLKSGKFPNLDDFDIASLAYYDEFLNQE